MWRGSPISTRLTGNFRCWVLGRRLRLIKQQISWQVVQRRMDTMVQATIMGLITWSHLLGTNSIMALRRMVSARHRTLTTATRLRHLTMAHPLMWAILNTHIILKLGTTMAGTTRTPAVILLDDLRCTPMLPILLVLHRLKTITINPHSMLLPVPLRVPKML